MPNPIRGILKLISARTSTPKVPKPVIWIPASNAPKPDQYLACAAIIKDEAAYLEEWISFHLLAGVQHIYLYDNGSTDDTPGVLARFDKKRVTVIPWPHFAQGQNTQCLAYSHAISNLRGKYKWLALIDADEFLFPVRDASLVEVLRDYEDVPALGVYWINFGTGGHSEYQSDGVLKNYLRRQRLGGGPGGTTRTNYKSIVQPLLIGGVISAHAFQSPLYPVLALDELRRPIRLERYRHVSCDRIRINHYFTKSAAEWEAKIKKASCRAAEYSVKDRRVSFYESLGPLDCEDHVILQAQSRLQAIHGGK